MLRLHGVIGRETDAHLSAQLHHLEHHDAIELLFVPEAELGRRRFRLTTDKGTSLRRQSRSRRSPVRRRPALPRRATRGHRAHRRAQDVAPAYHDAGGGASPRMERRPSALARAVEGRDLVVLLDGPVADYQARIAALIAEGSVEQVDDP